MRSVLKGVLPVGDPLGGVHALVAVFIAPHDNIGSGGLNRKGELLRGVRRVDRGGKERIDMRAMSSRPRCLYARLTMVCLAAAAAVAASIAAVRAWETFDDTGMTRVSDTDSRPTSSAEVETSTQRRDPLPLSAQASDLWESGTPAAVR